MYLKLYYGNLLIGNITNVESNFPSLNGSFNSLLKSRDTISLQILDYINFSSEQTEFYLDSKTLNKDTEQILMNDEKKFENLINSSSWRLIDYNGEETKILIPTFDKDGIISYRFDF